MPFSLDSHLRFWNFSFTNGGLRTLKDTSRLFCTLWLSLCLLAECEGIGQEKKENPEKYRTKVTFDPNTAYPGLAVSPDRTYVESRGTHPNVPDEPERFSSTPALLGLPRFTSGKHYWEVKYGDQREWAVGVALESANRKGAVSLAEGDGIWQVGRWWLYRSLETGSRTGSPGVIGVFLEYDAGRITFYMDGKVIEKRASFNGKKVVPFFYVGGAVSLKLI
uniref:vespryn-like n=1 Tax=Euleptes europaea TaxID=460621 RepID=UPI00253FC99E|nr:vespryn-like [Euleptes europaea]